MRSSKAKDYWKTVYNRNYKNRILKINLNGLNSLSEISLSQGVVAICGLNGAGKSTVISAIKDVIGLSLTKQDSCRLNGYTIEGLVALQGEEITCRNTNKERLFDKYINISTVRYIDCTLSTAAQNYMIEQTNLNELLEQYEECPLNREELKDINYLTGKQYSKCSFYEIEDLDENGMTYPFFRVEIDNNEYDTRSMGTGEHFLLCLFWCIKRLEKDTILIVEEPETYISITSQIHFINHLAKEIAAKGINVILTTHSPYILKNIKNENIKVISRVGNTVSIRVPHPNFTVETALGISQSYLGTIFVEDKVAADLLRAILEDKAQWILKQYDIAIVGGEANISKRLEFPRDTNIHYSFIGVYDGDMKDKLDTQNLNWGYCFLPGDKAFEEFFRGKILQDNNLDKLCAALKKDISEVISYLSIIEGYDHHDWFISLCNNLSIHEYALVKEFYSIFMAKDTSVEIFIRELQTVISNNPTTKFN